VQPDATGRSTQREGDLELPLPEIDIDYRSMDDRYRDIAEEIPGFGGLFVDEGILQVYLQPDAFMNVAGGDLPFGEVLRLEEMPRLQESLVTHLGEQMLERAANGVVVLQGEYDYRDLLAWRTTSHELVFTEHDDFIGLFIFDVDESQNRVVLSLDYAFREEMGLPRDIPEDVLQEQLSRLEIPVDAVIFDSGGLMQATQTLNEDINNPPIGGIKIYNKAEGACSLGFNAILGSKEGFITASHCTNNQFNPDATGQLAEFEQRDDSSPPVTFFMGTERYDLAAWNDTNLPPANEPDVPNNPCYTGNYPNNGVDSYPHYDNGNSFNLTLPFRGCRRADAAFIEYNVLSTLTASNFGRYAFPPAWQVPDTLSFTLPINPASPNYPIRLSNTQLYPKSYSQTQTDSTIYNPPHPPEPSITLMDNTDIVQKVGYTTGRTIGRVRKTDADFYLVGGVPNQNFLVLHLGGFVVEKRGTQPRRLVAKGDSGGPVFQHFSDQPQVDLLGIVVGKFRERSNPGNDSMNVSMGVATLQHIGEEMQEASGHTLRVSN
jgi:hypothetical protein